MRHEPARTVIEKLGGFRAVADMLGKDVTRIYRWTYPKERGGTEGHVPAKDARRLIDIARTEGLDLSPSDFFPRTPAGEAREVAA